MMPSPQPADTRPTLLIADDDPVVCDVLGYRLEAEFRLVGVAGNTTEAIRLAGEHHPDAALIDVAMPGGGARKAVPAIAACSPGTRQVILSADERHDMVVDLLNAGAIAYIRKGLTGSAIAKTLLDALAFTPTPGSLENAR